MNQTSRAQLLNYGADTNTPSAGARFDLQQKKRKIVTHPQTNKPAYTSLNMW